MELKLIDFNNNIVKINKELSKYEDNKGTIFLIPTQSLLVSCEYKELTDEEYKQMIFNKTIDKNLKFEEIEIIRPKLKYEVTKKEEDKGIIVDTKVKVKKVWFIKNGLNLSKAFNNKEEAIKLTNELNNKYLKMME